MRTTTISRLFASPVSVFSLASLLLFIAYLLLKPPLMGPDELNHFFRAYQVSEGNFLAEHSDHRLGGNLPICVKELEARYRPFTYFSDYKFDSETYLALFDIPAQSTTRQFIDFPNTAYYSAFNYIPYALAIYLARHLHLTMGIAYYAGKLAVFLLFFFGMRLCIRITPVLKWPFCMLALLPMQQYLLNSFSGDPITTLLSYISIALLLQTIYVNDIFTKKTFFSLLLLAIALSLGKVIYVGLFLPMLLIPVSKFGTRKRKYVHLAFFALVVGSTAIAWSQQVKKDYVTFETYNTEYRINSSLNPNANLNAQQLFLKQHPKVVMPLLSTTLREKSEFYLRSFVGGLGAYIDVMQSLTQSIIVLFALIVLSFGGYGIRIPWTHKLFYLGLVTLLFLSTLMSQYVLWTPVGGTQIEGVQGRYFFPFLPFLLLLATGTKTNQALLTGISVFILGSLINSLGLQALVVRYYGQPYVSTYNYKTGFEKNGEIPADSLQRVAKVSHLQAHSGESSLLLLPGKRITLLKNIPSVLYDDITTLTIWVKGKGCELAFVGPGEDCGTVQIGHSEVGFTNEDGWSRLLMHYAMFYKCKSNTLSFEIENKSTAAIYVDDLAISIVRKK